MPLKYKVIKNRRQYNDYSNILDSLVSARFKSLKLKDELDLLTVLIEKWERDQVSTESRSFDDAVTLVRYLIAQRNPKAKDLVEIPGVTKGLVSEDAEFQEGLVEEEYK